MENASQNQDQDSKSMRHRSPAWPFIPLAKAVDRAGEFYRSHRDRSAKQRAANVAWSMKPTSGAGPQTIAALKHYGLMESGSEGVKLTDLGLRIVRDTREISPEREAALREAALSPAIFAEIWQKWGRSLKDADVEYYLVQERHFGEDAARGVLLNYKSSVRYANLSESGNSDSGDSGGAVSGQVIPPANLKNPPIPPMRNMEGERVVFTHEIEPTHGVRILASGEVDESMLDALGLYIELQKKRLKRPPPPKTSEHRGDGSSTEKTASDKAQVSFMITNAQKAELRKQGYSDDQIAKMQPEEAHRLLKVA
jgi:hypothetical protein